MRREQVLEKLALVDDPELDEPLTELGFIRDVEIENDDVSVSFRLPTFWCSPNFAFIMAEDIRDRVSELPWVRHVHVTLIDHCASDEINEGISKKKSFTGTFQRLSDGELDELRKKFRHKAFLSRQERLYRYLLNHGFSVSGVLGLSEQSLTALDISDDEGQKLVARYTSIRKELGLSRDLDGPAFTDNHGVPLCEENLPKYLLESRRTRISQEFNAIYCRGLLQARYGLADTLELEESKQ